MKSGVSAVESKQPPSSGSDSSENAYVFPATFAQQRLWFLDQLQPGGASYNIPWSIQISGKLNAEALERSLNEIVRRHEVLRTTFSVVDGEPVQRVVPSLIVALPLTDLAADPEPEHSAKQEAVKEAQKPLD